MDVNMLRNTALAAKDFSPVTDPKILSRLPAEGRDKVLKIDLKSQGVTEFGEISKSTWDGFHWQNQLVEPELFVNEKAMTLARYPKDDMATADILLSTVPGSIAVLNNVSNIQLRGITFETTRMNGIKVTGVKMTLSMIAQCV